jgi:hypothetical protein
MSFNIKKIGFNKSKNTRFNEFDHKYDKSFSVNYVLSKKISIFVDKVAEKYIIPCSNSAMWKEPAYALSYLEKMYYNPIKINCGGVEISSLPFVQISEMPVAMFDYRMNSPTSDFAINLLSTVIKKKVSDIYSILKPNLLSETYILLLTHYICIQTGNTSLSKYWSGIKVDIEVDTFKPILNDSDWLCESYGSTDANHPSSDFNAFWNDLMDGFKMIILCGIKDKNLASLKHFQERIKFKDKDSMEFTQMAYKNMTGDDFNVVMKKISEDESKFITPGNLNIPVSPIYEERDIVYVRDKDLELAMSSGMNIE